VESICAQLIENVPSIIEDMKKETEERMVNHFNSFYYYNNYQKGKREVILTTQGLGF
jgi:site-specific DNA-cytosine methylase